MFRDIVLFFLENNKIYFYNTKKKKEKILDIDTSLFFQNGEIKDIQKFRECIKQIFTKDLPLNLIKPKLVILYNDFTNSDMEFLYKSAFDEGLYSKLTFYRLSKILAKFKCKKNLVYFDGKNFFSVNKKEYILESNVPKKSIIVGDFNSEYKHYNDKNAIWNTFKSDFTND